MTGSPSQTIAVLGCGLSGTPSSLARLIADGAVFHSPVMRHFARRSRAGDAIPDGGAPVVFAMRFSPCAKHRGRKGPLKASEAVRTKMLEQLEAAKGDR